MTLLLSHAGSTIGPRGPDANVRNKALARHDVALSRELDAAASHRKLQPRMAWRVLSSIAVQARHYNASNALCHCHLPTQATV